MDLFRERHLHRKRVVAISDGETSCPKLEVYKKATLGTSGGPVVKSMPASAGDMGLVPGPGRFHRL